MPKAPPLPLEVTAVSKDDLDLQKKTTYMLKVASDDPDSADYKFSMYHVDGTNSICDMIQWYKDILQVINGLNLQANPDGMIPLIERVCESSAKCQGCIPGHSHECPTQIANASRGRNGLDRSNAG
jgi:hypothetical protein